MGRRFASFYRRLAFARVWKVKFCRPFVRCQYFNDGWTDFHKNIYLYIFILDFYSKTVKTRVSRRVKMMTRWPGRERWPKRPIYPVTQWPSSMSAVSAAAAAVSMQWCCHACYLHIPDSSRKSSQRNSEMSVTMVSESNTEDNIISWDTTATTSTVLRPVYRSTCVSRMHLQLRTGVFCWCKVLLPTCPCWRQPAHSD